MKRLLVVGCLLVAISATGQVKGFVGLKGGGQAASAYIEHTIYTTFMDIGIIPGYHGGVIAKLFTNQNPGSFLNAGLQSGLTYSQKGWRQHFPTEHPSYTVKMSYLEVPVEAMIYAGKQNFKVFSTLGVYTEYLLNVDKDPDPDTDPAVIGNDVDFYTYQEGYDKTFGYGCRVSLGVQYESPIGAFHADGFFGFSISSFMRSDDLGEERPDLSNHYTLGFSLAYLIPFGKMEY
ncbi:outer membrane beta-barrel protein [Marinoscillum furvescens]|uniref:Outer membrane protein with beta-barrel domain n=1 Tax=Marinoscillum furvescens DSM 4134 TaxID=1122208 RepID=A0A3D9L392_MARFU|nr:outer membrane beta-barrel protein [Marinoscillum furvescens]RED97451.1 outer membrane protein with beta-barrel domain [Marinoscillum furvescens DSM 4134]